MSAKPKTTKKVTKTAAAQPRANVNTRKRGSNPGGKVGRPTKLTPEALSKTEAYYERMRKGKDIPYLEELALMELDVDPDTITNWCHKAEDKEWLEDQEPEMAERFVSFFGVIKKVSKLQLLRLKVKGVEDRNNPVAIFLMKADHGMIETQRHELGGIEGGPIEFKPIEVLSTKGRKRK